MALGLKALGRRTRLINFAPIVWSEPRAVDIARIAAATAARLDLDVRITPADIDNHDDYIGERYGVVTEGGREAMRLLAGTEGIILDPVYSAKAMAGLIDHVRTRPDRQGPDRRLPAHRRHPCPVRLRRGPRPGAAAHCSPRS